MDAQTRHQLKQNELAEALEKLRDWDNPTTRYVLVGVVAVVVLFGGWNLWSWSRQRALTEDWRRFGEIETLLAQTETDEADAVLTDLRALIADTSQPALETAARLRLGRLLIDQAYIMPDQRDAKLQDAVDVLDDVRANPGTPPAIAPAALFLLATAHESLGQFEQADDIYATIEETEAYQRSPYARIASSRRENLDEMRTPVEMEAGMPPASADDGPGAASDFGGPMGPQVPNPTFNPTAPPAGGQPQTRQLTQEEIQQLMERMRQQGQTPPGFPGTDTPEPGATPGAEEPESGDEGSTPEEPSEPEPQNPEPTEPEENETETP